MRVAETVLYGMPDWMQNANDIKSYIDTLA